MRNNLIDIFVKGVQSKLQVLEVNIDLDDISGATVVTFYFKNDYRYSRNFSYNEIQEFDKYQYDLNIVILSIIGEIERGFLDTYIRRKSEETPTILHERNKP